MALPLAIPFIGKALAVGAAAVGIGYAADKSTESVRNITLLIGVAGVVYLFWGRR